MMIFVGRSVGQSVINQSIDVFVVVVIIIIVIVVVTSLSIFIILAVVIGWEEFIYFFSIYIFFKMGQFKF